jgi:hypothetical protein
MFHVSVAIKTKTKKIFRVVSMQLYYILKENYCNKSFIFLKDTIPYTRAGEHIKWLFCHYGLINSRVRHAHITDCGNLKFTVSGWNRMALLS